MGRACIEIKPQSKFGRWTVICKSTSRSLAGYVQYHVQCECGVEAQVIGVSLRRGLSTQCRVCAAQKATRRRLRNMQLSKL